MKKNLLKISFLVAGITFIQGIALFAAENNNFPNERSSGQNGNRRNSGQRGGQRRNMMVSRVIVEAQISHADPQKYAELEKVRSQYEKDMAALAETHGIKLPESREDNLRKLWKANPEKFVEICVEIKNSPREGMRKLFELAKESGIKFGMARDQRRFDRHGNNNENSYMQRKFNRPDMSALRRNYPEEMKKYDDLRRKDPTAGRKFLIELIEKDRKQNK